MRMKFNKSSQLLLVTVASPLVAGVITACGTATTDFVFVASAKGAGSNNYGEIDVFEINSVSGAMRQIPSSPFPSQGRNPVAEAVSADYSSLYVVNQDDNTVVQFFIGRDGKLYPQSTVNTPGTYPLAVTTSGSYLYVLDTYQPLVDCSTSVPCSGSIAVFPIQSSSSSTSTTTVINGSLGSEVANGSLNYWPLNLTGNQASDIILPTAVNVLTSGSNTYVYVSAYDSTAGKGYIFAFKSVSGVLSAVTGSPFAAGTQPSAITSYTDSNSNSYVYVSDYQSGQIRGFAASTSAASSNLGALTELSGSPFAAGNEPSAIVADPAYPYVYVANAQDGTVMAYSIASGELTSLGASYTTGIDPVAIGIDPSTNHFLFTVNFLNNTIAGSVSDFELSSTAGTLIDAQHSPYSCNALPTAVAAIAHGGTQK
jgi:hypothetical protein